MVKDKIDAVMRLIDGHSDRCPVIVAIDGRCAAGKTTLAGKLGDALGAAVVHMDDFFLRPEQRTAERLAVPGGNVDHERFLAEVLLPLKEHGECTYRPYRCSTGDFGDAVTVSGNILIVEGSYSCHPELYEYYDVRVFMTVSADEQLRRIVLRNGADKAEVFRDRWIPLEEKYFAAFDIAEKCDIVI